MRETEGEGRSPCRALRNSRVRTVHNMRAHKRIINNSTVVVTFTRRTIYVLGTWRGDYYPSFFLTPAGRCRDSEHGKIPTGEFEL